MVEPVNLRQFRKRKQRAEKEKAADANRKLHGISTKLKKQTRSENDATNRKLDGNRLTPEE